MTRIVPSAAFGRRLGLIPYLATRFGIVDEMNVIPGGEEHGAVREAPAPLLGYGFVMAAAHSEDASLDGGHEPGPVWLGLSVPRRDLAVACRNEVETSAELDREESRAVLSGNAVKLLPRLAGLAQKRTKDAGTPQRARYTR